MSATEFRLTPEASADLDEITRYSLERYGRASTERYLRDFEMLFERLRAFPELGSLQPGIEPPIRATPCRQHRIFHRFENGTVLIVRILHAARDADFLLN